MISEIIIAAIFLVNYGYVESGTNPLTIIGGATKFIEDYPFLVSVQYHFTHCGGCIISSIYVLTAAHCVHGRISNRVYVRIGSSTPEAGAAGLLIDILQILEHPYYDNETKVHDISLLLISDNITYNTRVGAIRFPLEDMTFESGMLLKVIGFGQRIDTERVKYTHMLKEADLLIVNDSLCEDLYGITFVSQICAEAQNISLTNRDAGSPVLFENQLIGILSRTGDEYQNNLTVIIRVPDDLNYSSPIMAQQHP